jgi:hypothetical protein
MSVESLEKLVKLAGQGAAILIEMLPEDVPGLGRLEARRAKFKKLLADPELKRRVIGDKLETGLSTITRREAWAARAGLSYIRRARPEGHDYFFANLGTTAFDDWLALGVAAESATLLDPLTGRTGDAAVKRGVSGNAGVYLQLASGESVIVRTSFTKPAQVSAKPWAYTRRMADGLPLADPWHIEFLKGGPVIPKAAQFGSLASWTTLPDEESRRFAGTARYRIEFDAPAMKADAWELDLGDVRETARNTLNGRRIATAGSLPFKVRLDALQARGNVCDLEVTNQPTNRIRALDVPKVP